MRLVLEDDSDFSGSESSGEEGMRSTATVELASVLPPQEAEADREDQDSSKFEFFVALFWMLSEAVLSVVRQ